MAKLLRTRLRLPAALYTFVGLGAILFTAQTAFEVILPRTSV